MEDACKVLACSSMGCVGKYEKERTTKLIIGSATEKAEGEQDENFIDPARRPGL